MTVIADLADADALLALSPEDLAPIALRTLVQQGHSLHFSFLTYRIYESERHKFEARFPPNRRNQIEALLAEAWEILRAERLLIPQAGTNGQNGHMQLTSRGKEFLENEKTFRGFSGSSSLPKGMLHPAIADQVWKALARGDLENAVLESYRAVEIAVRDAGKFSAEDIGAPLMREAFDPKKGLLTDMTLPESERIALAHLFSGAIGFYKNPQSHRDAKIGSQAKAQEIVLLASHLLRIVDERRSAMVQVAAT